MVVGSPIVFVVSLLTGAIGIYVERRLVAGVDSYTYAIITGADQRNCLGGVNSHSDGFCYYARSSSSLRICE